MREKLVLIDGHSILNRAFYGAIGDVSKDQIEGKIVFRIWPLKEFGSIQ